MRSISNGPLKYFGLLILVSLISFNFSYAEEFSSNSFKVLDPVIQPSSFSTSTSFQLWSTFSQISVGTSSASSFNLNSGFLPFPIVSTPAVSVTPGDAQISLSWTASSGALGWTVSGYDVGQSTVSGGPYTYTSLGNVTSSVRSSLSNGTAYYFVIVVKDVLGNAIATSTQVSETPVSSGTTPSTPPVSGGGGGGGGGGAPSLTPSTGETGVIFSGRAYPLSKVSFLKDGQLVLTTIAGPDSNFSANIKNISSGNYTFSVFGEDSKGLRSIPFSFPIFITAGVTTKISGIFIAPTISVDKSEVKRGDNIVIFGQSAPASEIVISVNSEQEFFEKTATDKDGVYLKNFDSSLLELGQHTAKSKASLKGEISSFSNTVGFAVGTKNVLAVKNEKLKKCDLNEDGRCNLVDFSIAAFWYKKPLSTDFLLKEKKHLNGDGKIDLIDFSIMAYYWTG